MWFTSIGGSLQWSRSTHNECKVASNAAPSQSKRTNEIGYRLGIVLRHTHTPAVGTPKMDLAICEALLGGSAK